MKILLPALLILLLLLVDSNVHAQCTPAVPNSAVVVSSTTTINGGFDPVWVCSGDTIHSDGGFHNIFLEPGSVMTTGGGIDTIYVKEGASFFMNGGIHVIFYVNTADIHLNGGIPYDYSCSAMSFDYTNAPANGCTVNVTANFESTDSILCAGSCINYTSLSENATSWQWSFPGAFPASSTDENPAFVCYYDQGAYDVTLIASSGVNSDTITYNNFITVNAQPAIPVITQIGDTMFSSLGYISYQWYFEGNLIPGATNYYYVGNQNGEYSVHVTDSKGCTASQDYQFVGTGIASISSGIRVYPNPATSFLIVYDSQQEQLRFVDVTGREIYSLRTASAGKNEIDVSKFPAVFFLKTETGNLYKIVRQ